MPIILDPGLPNPVPPAVLTSPDGVLTAAVDSQHGGVLLKVDFTSLTPKPHQVRVYRTDGTLVRSGDPAEAPGGVGVAYDHEAPLGSPSGWYAVPVFRNGAAGAPSQQVAATVPAPTASDTWDCWLKPLHAPGLAMRLPMPDNDPAAPEDAQLALSWVPGSRYPAGTWDKRTPTARELVFRTNTVAERNQFLQLIDEGPLLLQVRPTVGIADLYCLPGSHTETYHFGSHDPRRDFTVQLQPISRPPTIDAALHIPGRSYADTHAVSGTFSARQSIWPTYANVVGL